MLIKKLSIQNFESFYSNQDIYLERGFNLFIGKNNSGKTTALELLTDFTNLHEPHRSEHSIPTHGGNPSPYSTYSINVATSFDELVSMYGNRLTLPISNQNQAEFSNGIGKNLKSLDIEIELTFSQQIKLRWKIDKLETPQLEPPYRAVCMSVSVDQNGELSFANAGVINLEDKFNLTKFKAMCYRFSANRNPRARYQMDTHELKQDASNLAYCINHFQTNDPKGHDLWVRYINRIFPEITSIRSSPVNHNFELKCYFSPLEKRRDDLGVVLDRMGTGIGNIAAILYVLVTSRSPKVIAIDEPNLFLHPKALRELLQILSTEGKQHQYILTGHSPDILTAIEPSTINYFDIKNSESVTRTIKNSEFHTIRSELSDLGIRMTELHARDRVLWVEGQTEEIVFPKLLNAFFPEFAAGTAVLRVTHTGTFERKKGISPDEVANSYKRLTEQSLVPPLVTILLDKEERKPEEIKQLLLKSKTLKILPVKMIENYVIDADAIHHVLARHGSESSREELAEQISNFDKIEGDGAAFLKKIFADSKPIPIEYRKTTHTVELFDWIIENKPDLLDDLKNFIGGLFKGSK